MSGRAARFGGAGVVVALLLSVVQHALAAPPSSARSRRAIASVRPDLERALESRGMRYGAPIFIRIFKDPARLEIWVEKGKRYRRFRTYDICAFSGGLGPKVRTGDLQSPEGFYYVNASRMNPSSTYHLSFNLGFPNAYDRVHGRTGSLLMVHGDCQSIGCYAMTDEAIEEIYALADAALRNGQRFFRVHVFPFRMTKRNLKRHGDSPWLPFWENLKEGYDHFQRHHRPPNVKVRGGRYVFAES